MILVGLGLAPIFPCMLHETPTRFGKKQSQIIMGYQMAVAYTGSTFMPPASWFPCISFNHRDLPVLYFVFCYSNALSSEKLNTYLKKKGTFLKHDASQVKL